MWYLVSMHKEPLFFSDNSETPLQVEGLPYVNQIKYDTCIVNFEPPVIGNSEEAVKVLDSYGVKGFRRKIDAKAHAKEIGLVKGFKYLNTKQKPPRPDFI